MIIHFKEDSVVLAAQLQISPVYCRTLWNVWGDDRAKSIFTYIYTNKWQAKAYTDNRSGFVFIGKNDVIKENY